jgi:catechol 2,3-dioxygenase-like lactoylglutathione lyase family enzyme
MDTSIDKQVTTFHLSLNVSDLARSIDFYQRLFGIAPAKRRPDYAKFELEDPPLALSLEPCGAAGAGALNHVGIRLPGAEELIELQRRLEMSGISSIREEGVECCYSRQTKFWVRDPDQTLWEFYVLEADLECAGDRRAPETVPLSDSLGRRTEALGQSARSATAMGPEPVESAAPLEWEHRLGSPFPQPFPFSDESLDEIRLRGTFNVPCAPAVRRAVLADCLRALAPAGRVVLHHLTGESPLPSGSLPLPGPAAVVEEVPVDAELFAWLAEAGYCDVRLLKFGGKASFTVQGIELRETIVEAHKPLATGGDEVLVVYQGPFRELVDDVGRVFHRGQRTWISREQWERFGSGPLAESFVQLRR